MKPNPITEIHLQSESPADHTILQDHIRHMNPTSLGDARFRITTQLDGPRLIELLSEGMSDDAEVHVRKLPM